VRICIPSLEKIQYWYEKTQNFTLMSNALKKFFKQEAKKVISKNVIETCTSSTFTHVGQTSFAYNFFVHFLKTFYHI
jgi:hypothetical protein